MGTLPKFARYVHVVQYDWFKFKLQQERNARRKNVVMTSVEGDPTRAFYRPRCCTIL
jgi:hypothetical protein